jgi:hypothetical protein
MVMSLGLHSVSLVFADALRRRPVCSGKPGNLRMYRMSGRFVRVCATWSCLHGYFCDGPCGASGLGSCLLLVVLPARAYVLVFRASRGV